MGLGLGLGLKVQLSLVGSHQVRPRKKLYTIMVAKHGNNKNILCDMGSSRQLLHLCIFPLFYFFINC